MKKSSLKFLTLSLLILLAQNTLSAPEFKQGTGANSTVAGEENKATEYGSSAFGFYNEAKGQNSSAFGYVNKANKVGSQAFGFENTADGEKSSAFGYLNEANGKSSSAFGYKNIASGNDSSAFGGLNKAIGENSSAFGYQNTANRKYGSAFGYSNSAGGEASSAFGFQNVVEGKNSSAFGNALSVTGEGSGAFGRGEIDPSSLGHLYDIGGKDSWAIGSYNKIAVGSDSNHILGNRVSIGGGIAGSVVLGDGSTVNASNVVSVGSSSLKRKIIFVDKGDVSATSSDAVTGSQLYGIAKATSADIDVNAWKTKLGVGSGGGAINAYTKAETDSNFSKKDGSNLSASDIAAWKAKLATGSVSGIANTASGNESTALGNGNLVSGSQSTAIGYKNNVSGNNSGAFGDPNVVSGHRSYAFGNNNTIAGDDNFVMGSNVNIAAGITNSVALGNNSTVSGSNEVSVGSATNKRKITNVADGEVSATSSDAVTGRQLYNAMQNSGALGIENLRNEVNEKIDDVKDEVRGIGSLSAALAGLHPMQYDPKAPTQVMAALGHYKNNQSVAVGLSYYFNDRFMMSAGVALSGEKKAKSMANVGFTLKLGKGSGVTYNETPQYVVQNEVKRLTVENQDLKSQLNEQESKIKSQDEKIKNLEEKLNMLLKNK